MRITIPDDIGKTVWVARKGRIVQAEIKSIVVEVLTEDLDEMIVYPEALFSRPPVNTIAEAEEVKNAPP